MLKDLLLGSLAIAAGLSAAISIWLFGLPLSVKIIVCGFGVAFSSVFLYLLRAHLKIKFIPYLLCTAGLGIVLAAPTLRTPLFYIVASFFGLGASDIVKEIWQRWQGVSGTDLYHLVAGGFFAFLGAWLQRPSTSQSSEEEMGAEVDEKLIAIWGMDTRAPGKHFYRDVEEVTEILIKLKRTATLWFSYAKKQTARDYIIRFVFASFDRWFIVLKDCDLLIDGKTVSQHVSGDVEKAHSEMVKRRETLIKRGKLDV